MTKRESGWYRVNVSWCEETLLLEWHSDLECWYDGRDFISDEDEVQCHDPQMVMTPEGQIVYKQTAHDPLYNTKQEG